MEYLVRKSGERLIHRRNNPIAPEKVPVPEINVAPEDQIEQMVCIYKTHFIFLVIPDFHLF